MRAIVDARVLPMTEPGAESSAIAWAAGRIVALGEAQVRRAAREAGVEPEAGQGRIILPGFVDAHMHFLHVGLKRIRPDLRGAASREEALQRLSAWLEDNPGTDPVIGEGWDESDWADPRVFRRQEIDDVCGDRPVVLRRICGHVAVASSAALPRIRARWDDDLVDAETGRLLEDPSLYLNEVLPASPEQLRLAVERACAVAHRLGVTTVGDYEQAPLRAALVEAAQAGRLGVRVVCSIYLQHLEQALAEGFRTGREVAPMLQDGGLKMFLDGSLGGHTAHMLEPYDDDPGQGLVNHGDDELDAVFRRAQAAGVQIHAHAIGDGAVEQGLQAFERLAAHTGHGDGRVLGVPVGGAVLAHRFEHFEIVHDHQVQRSAALGLWASSQPNFVGEWSAKGGMYEQRIGVRYRLNNRFRSFLDAGMRLAFGSDGMPFGPLFGLQCAIGHPEPQQRLTIRQALWHYTHEAARSLGRSDVGTLEPGQAADLLILEQRDLAVPPVEWILRETVVAGQTVARGQRPCPTDDDVALQMA